MRRRWVRLTLLGAVVFGVALIFQIPAGWALYLARDRIPQTVQWQGVSGSVFDASVERVTVSLPGGARVVAGPVTVRTGLVGALTGSLPVDFRGRVLGGEVSGRARLGPGGWRIPDIHGRLDLGGLPRALPQLEVAGLSGEVLFRGQGLAGSYRGTPRQGRLRASVESLQAGLIRTDRPLGDYALDLTLGEDGGLQGQVRTVAEDPLLGIKGQVGGSLGDGAIHFRGSGWAADDAPPAVRDILPLLGDPHDGRVRIQWQGRLR
ncbi:MAG TPA: type II secretion system protein N [Gammaproteobacteria bacterium]|nr:type II secretion system protein N [Gammaproteobacteria bacterium]